jgi:hypothetical protein
MAPGPQNRLRFDRAEVLANSAKIHRAIPTIRWPITRLQSNVLGFGMGRVTVRAVRWKRTGG